MSRDLDMEILLEKYLDQIIWNLLFPISYLLVSSIEKYTVTTTLNFVQHDKMVPLTTLLKFV